MTVGVLCTYNGQVELLRLMWKQHQTQRRQSSSLFVDISSVDMFQGAEKDFIFKSLSRSNDSSKIGFCNDARRLNVALSKAKLSCTVVGDCKHCYDSDSTGLLWELVEYCDENGFIVDHTKSCRTIELASVPGRCNTSREGPMESKPQKQQAIFVDANVNDYRPPDVPMEKTLNVESMCASLNLTLLERLLDFALDVPAFSLVLGKCGSLKYKPDSPCTANMKASHHWETWSFKAWSYLHEMHGPNVTDDPCNILYAILFSALVVRSGYFSDSSSRVCERCRSVDLYDVCAKQGLVLPTTCVLAYVIERHQLNMETHNRQKIRKIRDALECIGAMCDVTQSKTREQQAAVGRHFPLVGAGARSFSVLETSH